MGKTSIRPIAISCIAIAAFGLVSPGAAQDAPVERPGAATNDDGVRTLGEERFTEALRAYTDAVSAHPNNARSRYLLGKARVLAGDPLQAIQELREATRLSRANADYQAELGNAYYTAGAKQAAAAAYRIALQLAPNLSTDMTKLWMSRARLEESQPLRSGRAENSTVAGASGASAASIFFAIGVAFGGDNLITATFQDGSSRGIAAGNGLAFALGLRWTPLRGADDNFDLSAEWGIKIAEISASNGSADLVRFPLVPAVHYRRRIGNGWHILAGGGPQVEQMINSSLEFEGQHAALRFRDALGWMAELGAYGEQGSLAFDFTARYTAITYVGADPARSIPAWSLGFFTRAHLLFH